MIQTHIGHLVFHINPQNLGFYKELFTFLGWSVCYEDASMLGLIDNQGESVWVGGALKNVTNDYDGPGLNHLALAAVSVDDVDTAVAWLKNHGVPALFETPRHRPEFCSPDSTYYQVMFESPDRILFEIVYKGPLP